jgi:hypothetical protein
MKEHGVEYPVITYVSGLTKVPLNDPTMPGGAIPGAETSAAAAAPGAARPKDLLEIKFRVQFCWKPTPVSQRLPKPATPPPSPTQEVAARPEATELNGAAPNGEPPNTPAPNSAAPNVAAATTTEQEPTP